MNESLDYLMRPQSIRDCAMQIRDLTRCGDGVFILDESRLEMTSELVAESIRQKYPTNEIPATTIVRIVPITVERLLVKKSIALSVEDRN